jgi:hypothetical protein
MFFPFSSVLLTKIFLMVGALAVFIGLLLNTFPRIMQRMIREIRLEP